MLTESNIYGQTSPASTSPASAGGLQPGITKVTIDGMVKTIAGGPVTGFALHQLAGFPDQLVAVGGAEVPKNYETYAAAGAEFVTKNVWAGGQVVNPEHVLASTGPAVDPPHSQTMSGVAPVTTGTASLASTVPTTSPA